MSKQYIRLPAPSGELTQVELKEYLPIPETDKAVIMRSLLIAELERCRSLDVELRTLRGLWYTAIKPALEKLGLLEPAAYFDYITAAGRRGVKPTKPPKPGKLANAWAGDLSKYLYELVKLGICTYAEMRILDGSRQRYITQSFDLSLESVDVVGVHYPNIVIFTEKDTIYPLLQDMASIYGISAVSCRGEPSAACTENVTEGIEEYTNREPLILLGLTDYDPIGYQIYDDQVQQFVDAGYSVMHRRIGLVPDQLTEAELINNVYSPPAGKKLNEWFDRTGGVNGQKLGLELDALPLSQIRRMFVDAIGQHISEQPYHDDLKDALIKILVYDALSDRFDEMRDELTEELNGHTDDLFLNPGTIRSAALAGLSYIDPEQVYDADKLDELRQVLKDAMQ